jgi:hypothetical protein
MPRYRTDSSLTREHLREIKLPTLELVSQTASDKTDMTCPSCYGGLVHGPVPCPDNKPGCTVVHYGYQCSKCGKYWH